ncbi:MAG: FTR1 family protein [Cycloclasticus sp.]|nr:FTR1 family protein [Cycloclasticus sp.]
MLINAVIIILREVLEASLIMGVLLAICQHYEFSRAWAIKAVFVGLIGSAVYAANLPLISNLNDGVGQEISNVGIYALIYIFVLYIIYGLRIKNNAHLITNAMLVCVVMAIIREGAEIIVFVEGFSSVPDLLTPVLVGGSIGFGIGASMGVFMYYLVSSLSFMAGLRLSLLLLTLMAGGMVSQAVQMLQQADLITGQLPIWDTSAYINEQSLLGQMLFAFMGYESTPTPYQVVFYMLSMVFIITFMLGTLKKIKIMSAHD